MTTLSRYVLREVVKGSLVALLVLLSLLTFFSFTDEMRDLGDGDYGLNEIFAYLILSLPRSAYDLMPTAALLGSLVTLGALANNREIVAMQAAGASRLRIIGSVLLAGFVLVILSTIIGESVAPPAEREAQMLKSTALHQQVTSQTKYGFWVRDGNIFINVRQIRAGEELGDISIYELDENHQIKLASHANRAVYQGSRWNLDTLKTTRFDRDPVASETRSAADWSSILAPELLNLFVVRPENLSMSDLWTYKHYLEENQQKSLPVDLAFWERSVNPFMTLVMLLVAVPFAMVVRRETSIGQRIVVGVTIGLSFYLFNRMFGHFGLIYELNPLLAAAAPTSLVFVIAMIAIVKAR